MDKMIILAKFDGWELGKTLQSCYYLLHGEELFTDFTSPMEGLRIIPELAIRKEMARRYFDAPQVDSDSTWGETDIENWARNLEKGMEGETTCFFKGFNQDVFVPPAE